MPHFTHDKLGPRSTMGPFQVQSKVAIELGTGIDLLNPKPICSINLYFLCKLKNVS